MRVLSLAFGPERRRLAGIALLTAALMASFGFEGPIVANSVAAAELGQTRPGLALALLAIAAVYVWTGIVTVRRVTDNLLAAVARARWRLIEATARADLSTVEQAGAENLLAALTVAPNDVLAAAPLLARAMRTGCYIAGTLIVLALLDWQLLALMVGILVVVFATVAANQGVVMRALGEAAELEIRTRQDLRAMVLGFKELRLNEARQAGLLAQLQARTEVALAALARAGRLEALGFVLQASSMLVASGICIFVLPKLVPGLATMPLIAAAVLMSNISLALVRDVPLLNRGEAAVEGMERLFGALRPEPRPEPPAAPPDAPAGAPSDDSGLCLDGVCYQYPGMEDEARFAFGPISARFGPGTITFIRGGNSGGKTTLVKLLAGVYTPEFGSISLAGQPMPPQGLREEVSAIFADPYLFERLYGWPGADPAMVNDLLDQMGIGARTRFVDGRFTNTGLSTGQRKRLAWVVAMIEGRPILLLDEWAADQDPEFREHFYRVMLPGLRAAGRTVIAVTNDDRYYDVADQLLRIEDGMLVA